MENTVSIYSICEKKEYENNGKNMKIMEFMKWLRDALVLPNACLICKRTGRSGGLGLAVSFLVKFKC